MDIAKPLMIALLAVAQFGLSHTLKGLDIQLPVVTEAYDRKPDAKLFQLVSFGHLQAAVDWIWIQSLINTDMKKVTPGKHNFFFYNADLLTELDPMFFEVYLTGANFLAVVQDDGPGARDLLIKAEKFRSQELPSYGPEFRDRFWWGSWKLPILLAYVYLFELHDMPSAAVEFQRAASLPGSPHYLVNLAKRLDKPGGQYEVGLRLLGFMMEGAADAEARKALETKRLNLFIGQYLYTHNLDFKEFLRKQPKYRASMNVASADLGRYWKAYLRANNASEKDPWGGRLSLDRNGTVVSTTPHERIFGLE